MRQEDQKKGANKVDFTNGENYVKGFCGSGNWMGTTQKTKKFRNANASGPNKQRGKVLRQAHQIEGEKIKMGG